MVNLKAKVRKLIGLHRNRNIGKYMDRWYIVPPEWNLPFCIRLHHIKMVDTRIHHNHPYGFWSIVVKGEYLEERARKRYETKGTIRPYLELTSVRHKWLRLHRISREGYHRIVSLPRDGKGVWTIIFHPRKPKEYEWGYLDENGNHIPQEHYKRPLDFASQKNIDIGNVTGGEPN